MACVERPSVLNEDDDDDASSVVAVVLAEVVLLTSFRLSTTCLRSAMMFVLRL